MHHLHVPAPLLVRPGEPDRWPRHNAFAGRNVNTIAILFFSHVGDSDSNPLHQLMYPSVGVEMALSTTAPTMRTQRSVTTVPYLASMGAATLAARLL